MRLPVFRVMLLALLRDPGALVLAFILPPLVYVVFASIFAGTSGDELRLRVAIYDAADTETTRRLAKEIRNDGTFRSAEREPTSEAELSDFVRQDLADAGGFHNHIIALLFYFWHFSAIRVNQKERSPAPR